MLRQSTAKAAIISITITICVNFTRGFLFIAITRQSSLKHVLNKHTFIKRSNQRRQSVSVLQSNEPSPSSFSSDNDPKGSSPSSPESDWMEAELTLLSFPSSPDPSLPPEQIARAVARSLQFVDHPSPGSGLARVFPFFTWECRKIITARRGGNTVENFVKHGALSPALQPFAGAVRVVIDEGSYIEGTPTRGPIASFSMRVYGSDVLAVQYASGMERGGVAERSALVRDMVMRLERQRRPPLGGCWLVRDVLDVRYAFAGDMGNAHVGG